MAFERRYGNPQCALSAADIPCSVESSGLGVMAASGVFVVDGPGLQAAVKDADEAVAELAEGSLVTDAAGAQRLVVGAGAGGGRERAERLAHQRVDQAVGRDGLVGAQEQKCEQRALFARADFDRLPVFRSLEGAEDAELRRGVASGQAVPLSTSFNRRTSGLQALLKRMWRMYLDASPYEFVEDGGTVGVLVDEQDRGAERSARGLQVLVDLLDEVRRKPRGRLARAPQDRTRAIPRSRVYRLIHHGHRRQNSSDG